MNMGRHTNIAPELREQVRAMHQPGESQRAFKARLAASGISLSLGSLNAILRGRDAAAPSPGPVGDARRALKGDDLDDLRRSKQAVARALREWEPVIGRSPPAARTYRTLNDLLAAVTAKIIELTPRPEADRYAPLEGAALAELIARLESSTRDEATELESLRALVQRQRVVIEAYERDVD